MGRTCYGGVVCMCVNQDMAIRHVVYNSLSKIENICLELNLKENING